MRLVQNVNRDNSEKSSSSFPPRCLAYRSEAKNYGNFLSVHQHAISADRSNLTHLRSAAVDSGKLNSSEDEGEPPPSRSSVRRRVYHQEQTVRMKLPADLILPQIARNGNYGSVNSLLIATKRTRMLCESERVRMHVHYIPLPSTPLDVDAVSFRTFSPWKKLRRRSIVNFN